MESILQIRKIYASLADWKIEILKGIIFAVLLLYNNSIYDFLNSILQGKYNDTDAVYIMKLATMIILFATLIYGVINIWKYINKNGESLLLLGVPNREVFFLYCIQRYEVLFLVFFLIFFWREYYQIGLLKAVLAAIINGCILLSLTIVSCFVKRYKIVQVIICSCMVVFSILFALGEVNYENAYKLIMSEKFDLGFLNIIYEALLLKMLLLFLFLVTIRHLIKCQGIIDESDNRKGCYRNNFMGDLLHKMGKHSSFRFQYLWLYRDKEFLMWKICSTVFFIVCCEQSETIIVKIIVGYVIGLISASYFANIYHFERKQVLVYYMSEYTFWDLIKDHVKSGIIIIGDNIFIVLLLNSIQNIEALAVVLLLFLIFFVMVMFLSTVLYAKYPRKIYQLDFIFLMTIMHFPILNLGVLVVSYVRGKENWSKMEYGE